MEIKAHLNHLRISPRKVKLAADVVRGLNVMDAEVQLKNLVKRSSDPLRKLLKSAVANAENNFKLSNSNLFVSKIFVNEGATLKRWMPRAMGRATQILKRTSNITIVLSEIDSSRKSASFVRLGSTESRQVKPKAEKGEAKETKETKETGETKEIKKSEFKMFGKNQKDQAKIHGSQSIDGKKKFQRRKAI